MDEALYLGKDSRTKVRQRGSRDRDIDPSIALGTNIPVRNVKCYNYIRRVAESIRTLQLCHFNQT